MEDRCCQINEGRTDKGRRGAREGVEAKELCHHLSWRQTRQHGAAIGVGCGDKDGDENDNAQVEDFRPGVEERKGPDRRCGCRIKGKKEQDCGRRDGEGERHAKHGATNRDQDAVARTKPVVEPATQKSPADGKDRQDDTVDQHVEKAPAEDP